MRLSVLLCAAGLTAVSAFAPISSQAGVFTGLRAATNDDSTVGAFDPLNLASDAEETSTNGSISGMGLAAATTAAWVASSDVASAAGPDWGIFEGVSCLLLLRQKNEFSFGYMRSNCNATCATVVWTQRIQYNTLSNNAYTLL